MDHLTSLEIGEYLNSGLRSDERKRVAAHLADCDRCRSDLVEARRALSAEAGKSRRGWVAASLAAAAVLALLVFLPQDGRETAPGDLLREDGVGASVAAVSPIDGAEVTGSPRFVWRATGRDTVYRFTLVSESGVVVHDATTPDTTLVLPEPGALPGGEAELYWIVDALLPDGRTATTGAQRFRAPP